MRWILIDLYQNANYKDTMKVNILDAHDRYLHFVKQEFDIGACCQDLMDKRPYGDHPFYIFAHARTDDDGVRKRLVWQPRLTKPKAEPNSMLFKGYPGTDNVKIIWMIPDPAMWSQFAKGLVAESNIVQESIDAYKTNRASLEAPEEDDLPDHIIDQIYREIALSAKPKTSAAYQVLSED